MTCAHGALVEEVVDMFADVVIVITIWFGLVDVDVDVDVSA